MKIRYWLAELKYILILRVGVEAETQELLTSSTCYGNQSQSPSSIIKHDTSLPGYQKTYTHIW
jgi:hypothetical protein